MVDINSERHCSMGKNNKYCMKVSFNFPLTYFQSCHSNSSINECKSSALFSLPVKSSHSELG
uniref:Uncharacterized protein n=1 Tax=Anguilla anguilla TaxID=7936 RepID=A0A0E9PB26_ANGAN